VAERSQLREIARAVDAALAARSVPVRCVAGPEKTGTTTYARERVVIEHDGGDTFGPPRSQKLNPRALFNRSVGAAVRIYARSPVAGADVLDHRGRCEEILDHVAHALDAVIRGQRKSTWTANGGDFEDLPDLAASDARAGALYVLRISYDRAVLNVAWSTGAAAEEAEYGGAAGVALTNETQVSLANGPDGAAVETGCGG
jgi:hypothetical protein